MSAPYATFLPAPTILRFELRLTAEQQITMPQGARLLHVSPHGHLPRIELWCHCDPRRPAAQRAIRIVGAGQFANVDPALHVGTVVTQHPNGRGVWHVFDGGEIADSTDQVGSLS